MKTSRYRTKHLFSVKLIVMTYCPVCQKLSLSKYGKIRLCGFIFIFFLVNIFLKRLTVIRETRCTRGDARSFFCTYKTYLYAQN